MTHDIAHCDYNLCPAKDRCRRYKVHLEDNPQFNPYCSYLTLDEESRERAKRIGSCPHFLLHEK